MKPRKEKKFIREEIGEHHTLVLMDLGRNIQPVYVSKYDSSAQRSRQMKAQSAANILVTGPRQFYALKSNCSLVNRPPVRGAARTHK